MASEDVDIRVRLREARKAAADAERVGKSVKGMGKDTEKAGRRSEGASRGFGMVNTRMRVMKGISVGAGVGVRGLGVALAGVGVAGVGAFKGMKFAVTSAVNLGEQVSKNKVVFKDGAAEVLKFAETTATGLGLSQRQALEAAGTFGNMLVPMGIARSRAGDMSTRMVQLAGDMASFNNASPEETLDAIRAGLSGETEPLRRFGVRLAAARVEEEALNMGLADSKDKLTDAMKAQASYAIILKDTKDQHGDYARTSDSLANRQRTLKAQWEDLGSTLGQSVIPELETAAGAASNFLTEVGKLAKSDLSTESKLAGVKQAAQRHFGPLVESVGDSLKKAEIGEKLAAEIEKAAPKILEAMGKASIYAADGFVKAFLASGPYGKMFALAIIGSKLGAFGAAGRLAGRKFGLTAAPAAAGTMATSFGPEVGKRSGRIQAGASGAFRGIGRGLGVAMGIGIAASVGLAIRDIAKTSPGLDQYSGSKGWGELGRDITDWLPGEDSEARRARQRRAASAPRPIRRSNRGPSRPPSRPRRPGERTGGGPMGNGTLGRKSMVPRADSGRRMKLEHDLPIIINTDGRKTAEAVAKIRVRAGERGG